MSRKRILPSTLIGQQGVNLVERTVLEMGFLWYPSGAIEVGIDGFIELRDPQSGEVLSSILGVQSKATAGPFLAETSTGFEYICDGRDLDYWLQGNLPIILVVSRPSTNEGYWISIKDYFKDPETRQARKIIFDKRRHEFSRDSATAILTRGIPKDTGIYLAPQPRHELLCSNLLSATSFAPTIFVADTDFTRPQALWYELRRLGGDIGGEWLLKNRRIVSFRDLSDYPWNKVCDPGTIDDIGTEEWAASEDAHTARDFVRLLNRSLREKLHPQVRYDETEDCFYFSPTPNLSSRTIRYRSGSGSTSRVVFQGYPAKSDRQRIAFYRHSAFRGHFVKTASGWFLEITPTYHFTSDGRTRDLYYQERLTGIKQLEKNPAVLGQLRMWADYLTRPPGFFDKGLAYIQFGSLQTFAFDHGLDDDAWRVHEDERAQPKDQGEFGEFYQ